MLKIIKLFFIHMYIINFFCAINFLYVLTFYFFQSSTQSTARDLWSDSSDTEDDLLDILLVQHLEKKSFGNIHPHFIGMIKCSQSLMISNSKIDSGFLGRVLTILLKRLDQ